MKILQLVLQWIAAIGAESRTRANSEIASGSAHWDGFKVQPTPAPKPNPPARIEFDFKNIHYWYQVIKSNNPAGHFKLGQFYKSSIVHGNESTDEDNAELISPEVEFAGNLRTLYATVLKYKEENIWEQIFLKNWDALLKTRLFYENLKRRPPTRNPWPDFETHESWDLYSASRLNDLMLLRFQKSWRSQESWPGPDITLENYCDFFRHIGFDIVTPAFYHPFFCEIVDVIEAQDEAITIAKQIWPAIMLGNMMFSRAGVKIRAPRHLAAKGVADRSVLFEVYWRRYRPTYDESVGWGHNSQWRTDFRRDYELEDYFAYNVDLAEPGTDPGNPISKNFASSEYWISVLKNRCLINESDKPKRDDYDVSPAYIFYIEPKTAKPKTRTKTKTKPPLSA